MASEQKLPKNVRREAAREKVRLLRVQHARAARRKRIILFSGLGVALIALALVPVLVLTSAPRPSGIGPANMASGGIKIGGNKVAVPTPALGVNETPAPSPGNPAGVHDIQIYVDYLCTYCGQFEATNTEQISRWLDSGAATVEIHPLALLDRAAMGSKYSTRATNAAACVANYAPNTFYDFSALLFANQPKEGTTGLTDSQLADYATQAGATNTDQIGTCIDTVQYKSWVQTTTSRATSQPIPGTTLTKIAGTPTIIVDGAQYTGSLTDPNAFNNFVLQQARHTPTPTPTSTR